MTEACLNLYYQTLQRTREVAKPPAGLNKSCMIRNINPEDQMKCSFWYNYLPPMSQVFYYVANVRFNYSHAKLTNTCTMCQAKLCAISCVSQVKDKQWPHYLWSLTCMYTDLFYLVPTKALIEAALPRFSLRRWLCTLDYVPTPVLYQVPIESLLPVMCQGNAVGGWLCKASPVRVPGVVCFRPIFHWLPTHFWSALENTERPVICFSNCYWSTFKHFNILSSSAKQMMTGMLF